MAATTKADFSQRDPRWAATMLGFATHETMGSYGCLVAAFANVAQAQGKDVTPAQVNQMLKDHGQFVIDSLGEKADIAGSGSLTAIFPDIKNIENKNWGDALADIKYFDIRSSATDDIIVFLDYHPEKSGIQNHYCRVIGINDAATDVEVVDSYTGKRIWLSSLGAPAGKLIYRAHKYRGPGTGFVGGVPASPAPKMVGIRLNGKQGDRWNMRTSPEVRDDNIRTDGYGVPGQTYSAEIVAGGWARILFRSRTAYVGPKAFTRV